MKIPFFAQGYQDRKLKKGTVAGARDFAEHGLVEELTDYVIKYDIQPRKQEKLFNLAYQKGIEKKLELAEYYAELGLLDINEGSNELSGMIRKQGGDPHDDWITEGEERVARYLARAIQYAGKIKNKDNREKMRKELDRKTHEIWRKTYLTIEKKASSFIDYCKEKEKEARKKNIPEDIDHYLKAGADYYFPIFQRYQEKRKNYEKVHNPLEEDTTRVPVLR